MRTTVERNYQRAKEILSSRTQQLHDVAQALLEFETLDGDEIDRIIRGEKIERKPPTPRPTAQAPVTQELKVKKPGTESGPAPAPAMA